jgi:hypothetical protein
MDTALTREQVLSLAPDDASAKAAGGLTGAAKWVSFGADNDAIWGECKGSGAKPYQAQAERATLATRCSCPSRKFPCKHGLALLLMYVQSASAFAGAARPAWVDEWLSSRKDRAAKKEKAVETAAAKVAADPAAAAASAAKREEGRWKRIEAGTTELSRWIADQFRRGLASFGDEQRRDARAMAARMVDAQAPGLSVLLLDAIEALNGGPDRQHEAIEQFGLLQLAHEGVMRRATLSPARLADVRTALGWVFDKDDVAALGEAVADRWRVLGQCQFERDDRLHERRVWLRGLDTGRDALLLDYAYGGRGWEGAWTSGATYATTLRYFPGSAPLRALAATAQAVAVDTVNDADVDRAVDAASHAFAANPWLPCVPLVLAGSTPARHDDAWRLHTGAGDVRLAIGDASAWSLLAFGGGQPLSVMGEWDGRRLRPLAAWAAQSPRQRWTAEDAL